ncbi:MAG: hypothetical protein MJE66_04280 [Proteobacteria bacterium]|nr:hypothetical protein [Pseudomonadota bacterium]
MGRGILVALALVAAALPGHASDQTHETRALLAFEPGTVEVGQVLEARVLVSTPPHHRVVPWVPPEQEAFWVLSLERAEPERRVDHWLHRTQIRLRPRKAGVLEWPAFSIAIEDGAGARTSVEIPARSFEVVSALARYPGREQPFGLRWPELGSLPLPSAWVAALGLGIGLALGAALGWAIRAARRARPTPVWEPAPAPAEEGLGAWARRELEAALAECDADPSAAATRAARTLRWVLEQRFGADAVHCTTEELSAATPPLAARSRWPELVRILAGLDSVRFPPPRHGSQLRDSTAQLVRAAVRWAADAAPLESA